MTDLRPLDKSEFFDVYRQCIPHATREQYEADWETFQAVKEEHEMRKAGERVICIDPEQLGVAVLLMGAAIPFLIRATRHDRIGNLSFFAYTLAASAAAAFAMSSVGH